MQMAFGIEFRSRNHHFRQLSPFLRAYDSISSKKSYENRQTKVARKLQFTELVKLTGSNKSMWYTCCQSNAPDNSRSEQERPLKTCYGNGKSISYRYHCSLHSSACHLVVVSARQFPGNWIDFIHFIKELYPIFHHY